MKRRLRGLAAAFIIAGAGLLLSACGRSDATSAASWSPGQAPDFIAVEGAAVGRGKLYASVEASGTVAGINEALIISEAQGLVQEVDVRLGQKIRKGEVLARLDDTIYRLSMEQARSAWENARMDLEAITALNQRGNASRTDLVRAQSSERGARAAYEQAGKLLDDRTITSPVDGEVAWIDESLALANYLNPGTPLARIVDNSGFRVDLRLGERQIGLLDAGARATVSVAAAGTQEFPGEVSAVAAGSDPATASYRVVVLFTPSEGTSLKSGMTARVSVETSLESEVLLVPSGALLREGERNLVYVDEDGIARQREILLGRRLGGRAEVLEGLEEGDIVVLSGTTRLSEGAALKTTVIGNSSDWR
jgi:membrane fusion protein, multidrug efflux system